MSNEVMSLRGAYMCTQDLLGQQGIVAFYHHSTAGVILTLGVSHVLSSATSNIWHAK